jgi:urease accessory protein
MRKLVRPTVRRRVLIAGCLSLGFGVKEAQAHLVTTGLGPIYDGAAHFALTPEDLLPVAGLAIFAALRGPAHSRWMLFTLPAFWLIAGTVGWLMGGPINELATASCFLLVGGLVATDSPLPVWAGVAIVALVAASLGYSDGSALPKDRSGILILLGIGLCVFTVFALIAALVLPLRSRLARVAMRISGSWIAATGLLLLGWSIRSGLGGSFPR